MESTDCMYLCSYEKEIPNMESDSFQVDMEPFSHPTNKDHTFSSKSNLSRSLSKKGEGKKKMMINPSVDDERDATFSLKESIMSQTSVPGTIDPQNHHQITIVNGVAATAVTGTTPSTKKAKFIRKRSSSFKQTSIINPTRIVFFFATLSSMGTILLICFTLSMAKYNGDKKFLD